MGQRLNKKSDKNASKQIKTGEQHTKTCGMQQNKFWEKFIMMNAYI